MTVVDILNQWGEREATKQLALCVWLNIDFYLSLSFGSLSSQAKYSFLNLLYFTGTQYNIV